MVVLNRIYTRTGDDGTTALGSGERRKKYDLRVSAYGTLDEVNAVLGLARLYTGTDPAVDAVLGRIQNDLFDVEADLCLAAKGPGGARMTITDAQGQWLGRQIEQINPASPGRAVCGRPERLMVEVNDQSSEGVTPAALKYVNRLADFLFVAGRHANDKGASDVLWQTGQDPGAGETPHGT